MNKKIRVIVVDDSALVRSLLAEIINRQRDMECIGTANDPLVAREMIREMNPDVITLDVEMPRMDGIEFLGRLMRLRPMPVVMISSLTEQGAAVTLQALEMGAVDFVAKPRIGVANGLQELADDIVEKIRVAAVAHVRRLPAVPRPGARSAQAPGNAVAAAPVLQGMAATPAQAPLGRISSELLVAIGASTGGPEAIREILQCLPPDCPPVVVTQHMPAGFTANFAARLDSLGKLNVKEAEHGENLRQGHAYIAPGGKQFAIQRRGCGYAAVVSDEAPVNRHKPSVEVLFTSVAEHAGRHALGVMLTGMGGDGAAAMRRMRDAGAYNLVQDQDSCVVFGMPREAIAQGAASAVLPLAQIGPALVEILRGHVLQSR